jgi:hypothetical protein
MQVLRPFSCKAKGPYCPGRGHQGVFAQLHACMHAIDDTSLHPVLFLVCALRDIHLTRKYKDGYEHG